jgi:hypothetical protein
MPQKGQFTSSLKGDHLSMSDRASDLLQYLRDHKEELNLAAISRKSGLESSYLKHAVAGRRAISATAEGRVRALLKKAGIATFPEAGAE